MDCICAVIYGTVDRVEKERKIREIDGVCEMHASAFVST